MSADWPDDHSHEPQDMGDGVHTVFVTDDEDTHYLLQHTVTSEGVVIDVYDRHGQELLFTDTTTWDGLLSAVVSAEAARWAARNRKEG